MQRTSADKLGDKIADIVNFVIYAWLVSTIPGTGTGEILLVATGLSALVRIATAVER